MYSPGCQKEGKYDGNPDYSTLSESQRSLVIGGAFTPEPLRSHMARKVDKVSELLLAIGCKKAEENSYKAGS